MECGPSRRTHGRAALQLPSSTSTSAWPLLELSSASAIPSGSVPTALYWDTADPYHYVRLQPLNDREDVLIVGGEDHKTGQASDMDRHGRLIEWAQGWFPMAKTAAFMWSGQILESIDGL